MEKLVKSLRELQVKLKAPKNQFNKFGGYSYRSCEDIVEAVKPLLPEGISLYLQDEIMLIGERYYIKSAAIFTDGIDTIFSTSFAREEENKKGMDGSQITGAASSYARKYALNALLLIDDNKDADATNQHDKAAPKKPDVKPVYSKPEPVVAKPVEKAQEKVLEQVSEELFIRAIVRYQEAGAAAERAKIESYLFTNYMLSDEQAKKWNKVKEEING